jgi:hypothetical protein
MASVKHQELLKDKAVQKEIERYKWIESEKAGADIGFEKASHDWLNRYADEWCRQHACAPKKTGRSAKRIG